MANQGSPEVAVFCFAGPRGRLQTINRPTNMEVIAVVLTPKLIDAGKTPAGAWNKPQIECLGLSWPLTQGWKQRLKGKLIPKADYEKFLSLATARAPKPKANQPEGSWHVKDGRLTFGKYKGERLDRIIKKDKSYIDWACQNVEGFASNLPARKQTKPRKLTGLVAEVLERMENGTSPYIHSTNAPSNAFDVGGFPTQDRMDYHMSQLNPNHRALEALEDHLDQNFMSKYGDQFNDDMDDAPPW